MADRVTQLRSETEFVPTRLLKMEDIGPDSKWQYEVILPRFLADLDIWAVWEKERLLHMETHLKPGDILFDIGVENAALTAVLARFVGPSNMVLFEPSQTWWPTIRAVWEENHYPLPKDAFMGFVGDATFNLDLDVAAQMKDGWPNAAWSDELCVTTSYRYLHEPMHVAVNQGITLDDYYKLKGFYPTAITIDVEGAEAKVLKGAREVLARFHPQVWCSVHPNLMAKNYNATPEDLFSFMASLGYHKEWLAEDHEEHHWFHHD